MSIEAYQLIILGIYTHLISVYIISMKAPLNNTIIIIIIIIIIIVICLSFYFSIKFVSTL